MPASLRLARTTVTTTVTTLLICLPAPEVSAQRFDSSVEGAESCREIWREFGRSSSGRSNAVYCEIRNIGVVPPRSTLDVDGGNFNGVWIRGAQRSDVRVRLVIQAQGRTVEEARELASRVSLDLTRMPWRATGADLDDFRRGGRRNIAITIVVDAPVESNVSARVRHAPLDVDNLRGRLDVSAEHGPLSLTDVGGDVRARVEHGPLSVRLSGQQWQGTGLDAEATHGPMTLSLPRGYSADLEIGARHGPIDVDFPLTLTRLDGSMINTKLGNGGPRVRAVAHHGPMSLRMER